MKKHILFDLDNTLFPEHDFVTSGFRAVSRYLHARYNLDQNELERRLLEILEGQGRGRVFNHLLNGLDVDEDVETLVYIYRTHHPDIRLYEDAQVLIASLRDAGYKLGIITDGIASVQLRKIQALGLEPLFDLILCTSDLGSNFSKPSVIGFNVALRIFNASAKDALYVGDDDSKDFKGPHQIGMETIQILRLGQRAIRSGTIQDTEGATVKFQDMISFGKYLFERS